MKLSQSPRISGLYIAPGNAGIGNGHCVDIEATDIKAWYSSQRIMLLIW